MSLGEVQWFVCCDFYRRLLFVTFAFGIGCDDIELAVAVVFEEAVLVAVPSRVAVVLVDAAESRGHVFQFLVHGAGHFRKSDDQ